MSAILKVRVPFLRRKTSGGSNGIGTFYLAEVPSYLPVLNQTCVIIHTNVPTGSGLSNKLSSMSTNVVTGRFQSFEQLASAETVKITDNFSNFFTIEYEDHSFSINQFSGDCQGFIEYDVNPSTYQILKPVENVAIVNENVPYDDDEGYTQLFSNVAETSLTLPKIFPGSFIRLKDNNTIFANLMKSLNLPVSDSEMKKYTRSELGVLVEDESGDIVIDGRTYDWNAITTHTTGLTLTTHPVNGHTGEHYKTVMQSLGSIEHPTDNSKTPIQNQVALIFEIPQAFYGEIIDGKTVGMTIPYWPVTAGPDTNGIYTYGSTETNIQIYGSYNKNGTLLDSYLSDKELALATIGARPDLERPIAEYESNVVLLFANEVRKPNNDSAKDWATGHVEAIDGVKVFESTSNPKKFSYDYKTDLCVGAAYLDKGFVVITHPQIVDSIFTKAFAGTVSVSSGFKSYDFSSPTTGSTKNLCTTVEGKMITTKDHSDQIEWDNSQFVFDGTTTIPSLEFISYNSEKSLNVVCLASADEFYRSTNPTAKELLNISEKADLANFKSEDANLYPIMITQIGIHDAQGNLLAVCKPTQPVKKYWFDVVSFNVKIRL